MFSYVPLHFDFFPMNLQDYFQFRIGRLHVSVYIRVYLLVSVFIRACLCFVCLFIVFVFIRCLFLFCNLLMFVE